MKQALTIKHRSRKSRIVLASLKSHAEIEVLEIKESYKKQSRQIFSGLRFLWEQKYILLGDYLAACKYVELYGVVQKISGYPQGFKHKVVWHKPLETSHVGWIQSELSLLDQNYLKSCKDDELLTLWKLLQHVLNKLPLGFKIKFNQLLFEETVPNFHTQLRLYLKAFQKAIPVIKAFMVEFWKQKSPH